MTNNGARNLTLNMTITWTKKDRQWLMGRQPLMPRGAKLSRILRFPGTSMHVRIILDKKSGMSSMMKRHI